MSRRLRYQVAVSLDGFIAGPNGEYDWIVMDPTVDFAALFKEFDTAVMGRKTYDVLTGQGGDGAMPGLDVVVFSRTLPATARPGVRIFNDDPCEIVAALKAKPGRDIWLYGGGTLFRALLDAGLLIDDSHLKRIQAVRDGRRPVGLPEPERRRARRRRRPEGPSPGQGRSGSSACWTVHLGRAGRQSPVKALQ